MTEILEPYEPSKLPIVDQKAFGGMRQLLEALADAHRIGLPEGEQGPDDTETEPRSLEIRPASIRQSERLAEELSRLTNNSESS